MPASLSEAGGVGVHALEKYEAIATKLRTTIARISPFTADGVPLPFPVRRINRRMQYELLVGALDQIGEGILIFDSGFRLMLANRAARIQLDGIVCQIRPGQDLEAFLQSLEMIARFVPTRPIRSLVSLARQGEPWQIRLTGEIAARSLICSPLPAGGVALNLPENMEQRRSLRAIQ